MCNSAIVCTSAGEQASEQETERERVRDVRLHIRSRIVRLTPPTPPGCGLCVQRLHILHAISIQMSGLATHLALKQDSL